jgi:hypothetical protein
MSKRAQLINVTNINSLKKVKSIHFGNHMQHLGHYKGKFWTLPS